MTRALALLVSLTVVVATVADEHGLTKAQRAELTQYFGFGPMQIYKIKPGISNLTLADLDGDGRTDVLLWNSYRSRFELFYQTDPNAPPETTSRSWSATKSPAAATCAATTSPSLTAWRPPRSPS